MAFKGRSIAIKKGGTTVGGLRTKSITVSNEAVDASSDDDLTWRQLHADTGSRFLSITGAGIFLNDSVIQEFRSAAFTGNSLALTVEFANTDTITGEYLVTSFNFAGEYNGALMFDVALETSLIDADIPSLNRDGSAPPEM